MRVEIHTSAGRHGVGRDDIDHAVHRSVVVVDLEPDSDPPKVLCIGPDRAGDLLEVIWLVLAEERSLVIHAMALRATFAALLPPGEQDR